MKFIIDLFKSALFTLFIVIVLGIATLVYYYLKLGGHSTGICWLGALFVVGLAGVLYVFIPIMKS